MMKGKPTKAQFLVQLEQVVTQIREWIKHGALTPGQYLPAERELAQQFRMSNNSIRQALDQLVQEGWIEKIPRVGNRVCSGHAPVELTLCCNITTQVNLELHTILDAFQRRYPWISVRVERQAHDIPGFESDGSSRQADLILINNAQFQRLALRGNLDRLELLPAYPEGYTRVNSWFAHEDGYYVRPIAFAPIVLCYNKEHFAEMDLPEPNGSWTWDDLLRAATRLSAGNGRYGFCFHLPSENRWPLFLLQSGERFQWDENGRMRSIRGTKLLESIRLCKTIVQNRQAFPIYMSDDNRDINRMFLEGKLSMILNSYMGLQEWSKSELAFDVSPVPFIAHPYTLSIAIGAAVLKTSKHPEEAMLLLSYLTAQEGQRLIRNETLSVAAMELLEREEPQQLHLNVPRRHLLYREMMFSFRTLQDLDIPVDQVGTLYVLLKTYWANMIEEDELCERLMNELYHAGYATAARTP